MAVHDTECPYWDQVAINQTKLILKEIRLSTQKVILAALYMSLSSLLRELHWMFSTTEGRQELASSAGFGRIVVVTLSREHKYPGGLEQVKAELSSKVMELAPPGFTDNKKVIQKEDLEHLDLECESVDTENLESGGISFSDSAAVCVFAMTLGKWLNTRSITLVSNVGRLYYSQ